MTFNFSRGRLASLLLFVGLLLFSNSAVAAEPLVWKFSEGGVYKFQMVQDMKSKMNLGPGGETVSGMKQTIDMTWEILSVEEDGTAVLTQSLDRIQMDITAPGQSIVQFDTASDKPAQGFAAMLAPQLKAMTKSPFQVTMSARGEVTAVEIPESLLETMSQGPGGALMGSLATEEGFKTTMAHSSIILPSPDELTEGHKWTTSFEMESPGAGTMTSETTYEYKGGREVDGQQLEVFSPTMKTTFAEGSDQNDAAVSVESQETEGEILFNRTVGRLESSSVHQLLEMTVTVNGNAVKQSIDQNISFRAVESE